MLLVFILFHVYKSWEYYRAKSKGTPLPQEDDKDTDRTQPTPDTFEQDEKETELVEVTPHALDGKKHPEALSMSVNANVRESPLDYAMECCKNTREFDIYQA